MNKPRMVEILDVAEHSKIHHTYVLDLEVDARPGQFCMLWLPQVNEKPMGFSNLEGNVEVTVKRAGSFTTRLFMLSEGDEIGFRGPYGRGFDYIPGQVLIAGGGCGIAPLKPLKDKLSGEVVISARTSSELLFADDFEKAGFKVHLATDDGSKGEKTYPHKLVSDLLKQNRYSCVYACGPEQMMKKIMDACIEAEVPCQLSLERYMKCGVGLCGSCTVGGLRVCKEGPVFRAHELVDTEFGRYSRDSSGSKRRQVDVC